MIFSRTFATSAGSRRRDEPRVGQAHAEAFQVVLGEEVDLVHHERRRHLGSADLGEDVARDLELRLPRRIGGVDDVEEVRRLERLVERRLEARDEIVRQLLDEADRVADEDARLRLGLERADGGVERGEELVLDVNVAAGQRAHERGLAGVRVADERDAP